MVTLLVLTGCNLTITNLTPDKVPANPSQIYTITASFRPTSGQIDPASISPRIIIDGQAYKMTKSSVGTDIWEFEYQIPAGRTSATYYFICSYTSRENAGGQTTEGQQPGRQGRRSTAKQPRPECAVDGAQSERQ